MMRQCPDDIEEYIHDYLDGEIDTEKANILLDHIADCDECMLTFQELNRTIALLQGSHIEAPANFTSKVMSSLPKPSRNVNMKRWLQRNPVLIAASLFLMLMGGTIFSYWGEEQQFSFSKDPDVVVLGQTVIVPEGKTVEGDMVVKNGDIKVEGTVEGNLTVINGDKYLAGAGEVTGDIEEIDQLFEWVWYNVKETVKNIF